MTKEVPNASMLRQIVVPVFRQARCGSSVLAQFRETRIECYNRALFVPGCGAFQSGGTVRSATYIYGDTHLPTACAASQRHVHAGTWRCRDVMIA